MWHDHDIDFARWLHPAIGMWLREHDSEFTNPALCYVTLGWHAVEFARLQHPAMWHVALGSWHWIRQVAAPWNMTGGSGITCHWIRQNVRHTGILHLVSISTITAVDMSLCTSLRNFIQIGPPSSEENNLAIANRSLVSCAHNTSRVTQRHWKRNHWIDHTQLTISRVIWRWILSWPWNVGQRSLKVIENSTIWQVGCGFLLAVSLAIWEIFIVR